MSLVCRNASRPVSRCLDHVLEPVRRIGAIADELDALDAGLGALVDLEHEIDAVVRQLDDLGLDADVEAAAAPIDLDEARDVRLHDRARKRAAFLRLDFGLELLVLDLLVALEGDAVDDRILDDRDDQPAALDARRTSWNRPVAYSAFTPSSIWKASSRPPGSGLK